MSKNIKSARKSLKILYFLGLFLALSSAVPSYIQSTFLEGYISLATVSLFFLGANIFSLFSILFYPVWIRKKSNYSVFVVVALITMFALLGLGLLKNIWFIFLFFSISSVSLNLLWINMDLFIESFSEDKNTGKIRTLYYTFVNFGWILSPILSAYLVRIKGYELVYIFSALILIPFLLILIKNKKSLVDNQKFYKSNFRKTLSTLWKNSNLKGIFMVALILQIFYSSAVIYLPLYLNQNLGFSWSNLGIMFSLMLLPFVLVELPAGIIADKYLGEKEILSFGFVCLISTLFLVFFTTSSSFWIWTFILILSRIGAALIEAMRESYFFKNVSVKSLDVINLFRTTLPIGYLFGSALGFFVVYFFSLRVLFLVLAILFLSSFYYIFILKDTK